ncbi:hypothetical protein [Qipengyuania aquimaris]|uniref:hypothetical protein n=1 Tax=Qipengyuania aquimaris TaxID=255984 RepID=UPI001FD41B33|nr:hypothetical protein [Qipengyuania aquimaris]UOR16194.1 hypothetical protein LCM05_03890 [Qipengyuania aquimaris]
MRQWVALAAALGLAACGGGSDFSVKVKGDASAVKQNLAKAGGGSSLTGVAPATMTSDADSLVFKIAAAPGYDPAEIRFEFLQEGEQTKVDVTVDVPEVSMGANEYLSESKVEGELRKNLNSWARDYNKSGSMASTGEIALTMSLVGVAAQQVNIDNVHFASDWSAGEAREVDYDNWAGAGEDESGWAADASYDDGGWGDGS